jgi:hypothetical protein
VLAVALLRDGVASQHSFPSQSIHHAGWQHAAPRLFCVSLQIPKHSVVRWLAGRVVLFMKISRWSKSGIKDEKS